MTTLQDLQKAAMNAAKKKKQQDKSTRTTTTKKTSTTNKTSQEQKETAKSTTDNIKNQWLIKWTMATTSQKTNAKAEQTLKTNYSDIYKQMWKEWFSEQEITNALKKRQAQENAVKQMQQNIAVPSWMVDWSDKQQNAYKQLVSEWYSETDAKQAINNYRKKIDDSMTTWEKRATRWKAFLQWISDVWQRQIGRPIDWAAWKIADSLQWSKLQQWVTNLANRVFWEDEVKAFQEQNKNAQIGDMTKWNILNEREQESWIWQRWEKWWQYWALAAESLAAWWIASWWARAAWTAAWSKLVWWLAGTVLWAWEWAIWADAFARWLEDRAATKWERITWAALWWILGWVSWYRQTAKALAQNKELAWLVQDTSNRWVKKAIKEWRVTTKKWLLKTETVQELSQKEKDALKIIKKEWLWNSKNPWKLVTNIKKSITKTASDMSDDMKNIKVTNRWKQELKQNLKAAIENANTPWQKTKIKTVLKQLNDVTDADKLWKLRKTYDDLFSEAVKSYNPNWPTPMQEIWLEWRQILNDWINVAAENAWTSAVKEWMKRLSTMITAENTITNNLAKQVWKDQITKLWRLLLWAKNTTRKALWTAAVWWGWAALWIKIAWNNSSNE